MMTHTKCTIELDENWDIVINEHGYISLLTETAATCQNVATECRCFKGGLFFFQDYGVDWFENILGAKYHKSLIAQSIRDAALNVIDVNTIDSLTIKGLDTETRRVSGELKLTTQSGENGTVNY